MVYHSYAISFHSPNIWRDSCHFIFLRSDNIQRVQGGMAIDYFSDFTEEETGIET